MNQQTYKKFICGAAILMGVILSNAYRGGNITELTAPLPSIPHSSFAQLVQSNYNLFSKISIAGAYDIIYANDNTDINSLDWLTEYGDLRAQELRNFIKSDAILSPDIAKMITCYTSEVREIQEGRFNFSYLNILSKCNNTAFVGWSNELYLLEMRLRALKRLNADRNKYISVGKEILFKRNVGWEIKRWRNPNIFMRLLALRESGILRQWIKFEKLVAVLEIFRQKHEESQHETEVQLQGPKPLKLTGNGVTVFVIFSIGLAVGIILFLIEYLQKP